MPIYSDQPVQNLKKDDALNFIDYVPAFKSIIATGTTPLAVGIFDASGSGKIKLMHMPRKEVDAGQQVRVRTICSRPGNTNGEKSYGAP